MSKYQLRLWFEQGGTCVWGMNENAKKEYGYAIKNDGLPISTNLTDKLNALEEEYATYLDWTHPLNPSLWTKEQKKDFLFRATILHEELKCELGVDFEVTNDVSKCIA